MFDSVIPYDQKLNSNITYLKSVGPHKAEILNKELGVFTFRDLLYQFPFRYVDKTKYHHIKDITDPNVSIQIKGKLISFDKVKGKRQTRLTALLKDESGLIELVWFKGVRWLEKMLIIGEYYVVYGKPNFYKGKKSIPHPEMEKLADAAASKKSTFDPVYSSTEKLDAKSLGSKGRRALLKILLSELTEGDLVENLSPALITKLKLPSRYESLMWIHFPPSEAKLNSAINRIKFEELFFLQLRLLQMKKHRNLKFIGSRFSVVGEKFNTFYSEKLPFELTGAQKRVIKEIRSDIGSGVQMNRLLQGDVGSGKTIVALMTMLIAIDNGYQACMMAPTEILAQQHYQTLLKQLEGLAIKVAFLSGTVTGKKRQELLKLLAAGEIDILVGTHALIEDPVIFKNLGLAITDEQHRFGVAQRAKLWKKNKKNPPHILVMTATPIPRTLAMTVYGDLDVSIIDELPPGRKDIQTVHRNENKRAHVLKFMHDEVAKGRQIYVVFPLIDESETLDLQNLQAGYEQLLQFFPPEKFQISIVHGRMKPKDKDMEMQRFVEGKTQIMVATTVIEVGVNVPNASVMIIENAERFGLSQLHQLRGRVGRGAEQSYCILMTSYKVSKAGKERIKTMTQTNNGFEIAEVDMRLRGPGDIMSTQQSGILDLKLVNLVADHKILQTARHLAQDILDEDPKLEHPKNSNISGYVDNVLRRKYRNWSRIS